MKDSKLSFKLIWIVLSIYMVILLWIIVFKFNMKWIPDDSAYLRNLPLLDRIRNFYPFQAMIEEGFYFEWDYFMNIFVYIPLGIYLSFVIKSKYKNIYIILISLFSSILFETIQLFTGWGGFDTTDMLCNTLGGIIGILVFIPIIKLKPRIINIVNIILIFVFGPMAIIVTINTILNYQLYLI